MWAQIAILSQANSKSEIFGDGRPCFRLWAAPVFVNWTQTVCQVEVLNLSPVLKFTAWLPACLIYIYTYIFTILFHIICLCSVFFFTVLTALFYCLVLHLKRSCSCTVLCFVSVLRTVWTWQRIKDGGGYFVPNLRLCVTWRECRYLVCESEPNLWSWTFLKTIYPCAVFQEAF